MVHIRSTDVLLYILQNIIKGLAHPDRMPEAGERDDSGYVAYKIRFGSHGIIPPDWEAYTAYARRCFGMDP